MSQAVESRVLRKLRYWFGTPFAALKTITWVSFAGALAGGFVLLAVLFVGGVFGFFD